MSKFGMSGNRWSVTFVPGAISLGIAPCVESVGIVASRVIWPVLAKTRQGRGMLTQNTDESSSSSASVDPTPAEAAQISNGTGSSGEPSLSFSMFSGIGADLVSGGCDWGDLPAPEEGDPFSLSARDSDSSLGSHVSPSLSKRSSTSANNDQSKSNGNSKNDSDKRNNDTDKSSSCLLYTSPSPRDA